MYYTRHTLYRLGAARLAIWPQPRNAKRISISTGQVVPDPSHGERSTHPPLAFECLDESKEIPAKELHKEIPITRSLER